MHASRLPDTQRRRRRALLALPAVFAAAVSLAACSPSSAASPGGSSPYGSAAPTSSAPTAPAASSDAMAVRQTSLGAILTDGRGFTLYAFDADKGTTSNCSGACAVAWPPAGTTSTDPQVGSGVSQSLVGTTTRADGTTQLTYAGRPLYLFQGDTSPGDTNGDGSTAFGARWDALTATGKDATSG